jgi:plastocyanin
MQQRAHLLGPADRNGGASDNCRVMGALRGLPPALALAALLPSAAAQVPDAGQIAGRVILAGRVRGVPLPSNAYQPRAVSKRGGDRVAEIRNVVVYLTDAPFAGTLPLTRSQIRQVNEAFTPRVIAITRGSTVDFPNADPIFHNVFSLSPPATFDLGRFPKGASRSRVFEKPGLVKVYCHLHSHMSATILVLDHPYFTVPDLDGSFTLADLPAGRYTLVAWHERVGERTTSVQIEPGRTTSAELSLPVEATR